MHHEEFSSVIPLPHFQTWPHLFTSPVWKLSTFIGALRATRATPELAWKSFPKSEFVCVLSSSSGPKKWSNGMMMMTSLGGCAKTNTSEILSNIPRPPSCMQDFAAAFGTVQATFGHLDTLPLNYVVFSLNILATMSQRNTILPFNPLQDILQVGSIFSSTHLESRCCIASICYYLFRLLFSHADLI